MSGYDSTFEQDSSLAQYLGTDPSSSLAHYASSSKQRLLRSAASLLSHFLVICTDAKRRREAQRFQEYLESSFKPWIRRFECGKSVNIEILERGLLAVERNVLYFESLLEPDERPTRLDEQLVDAAERKARFERLRLRRPAHGGYYLDLPRGWTAELMTPTDRVQPSTRPVEISGARERHYFPDVEAAEKSVVIRVAGDSNQRVLLLRSDGADLIAQDLIGESHEPPSMRVVEEASRRVEPEKTAAPRPAEPEKTESPNELFFSGPADVDLSKITFVVTSTPAERLAIFGPEHID